MSSVFKILQLNASNINKMSFCYDYQLGKNHLRTFPNYVSIAKNPLELIHVNLVPVEGFRYYIVSVDDFSRFVDFSIKS